MPWNIYDTDELRGIKISLQTIASEQQKQTELAKQMLELIRASAQREEKTENGN